MNSVERYRQEWTLLLGDLQKNPDCIRDRAFNSELKNSKFRSLHWAVLLRVLDGNHQSWSVQRNQQRQRYERLKQEFVKNPYEVQEPDDDPLSQSKQSIWNQYFNDQELFAVIRQDVIRTFPGVEFFRKTIVQDAMINILFYYAREHPYMSYRQGMHEIVSPILFVLYGDHQSLLHFNEISGCEIDSILLDVLNPDYLEADAYSIFSRLMSSVESYYRVSSVSRTEKINNQIEKSNIPSTEVEVIGHLNFIRDKILAKEDLHLHNYLLELDIPLHIFGIRWLRLLFGREFPLLDLLILWDAIFADGDRFDLPNYILVAMLIRIRDKLLLNDYTTCLTFLMRYPTNVDVNLILRHALHMQMPKKFESPPNAFVYFTIKPDDANHGASGSKNSGVNQLSNQTSVTYSQQLQKRARSTPKIDQQITQQQERNAAQSATLAKYKAGVTEFNRTIMEGYSKNSPELLRLEVKNAQTIIKISRKKLQSYLGIVRKHVTKNTSEELLQALDGIEELTTLLDAKLMFPLHVSAAPIDSATEANEQKQLQVQKTRVSVTKVKKNENIDQIAIEPTEFLATPYVTGDGFNINPNHLQPTDDLNTSRNLMSLYEKPDETYMDTSKRVLGNRKEIELIPITTDERPTILTIQTNVNS